MSTKAGVPLIEGVNVASSIGSLYVSPASVRTRIDNIVFTNYTAAGVTLTVQIIESGGSAGNTNIVVDDVTVPAHDSISPVGLLQGMNPGDDLQAVAGSATSINCRASGTTFDV